MSISKVVDLVRDLKTGDILFLDNKDIIRFDDEKVKVSYLKKIEPRVIKVKRNDIVIMKRKSNNYGSALRFNNEYRSANLFSISNMI